MGILSWKKEFYPKTAKQVAKKGTDKELLEHSLQKWRGMLPENLEKHELHQEKYYPQSIVDKRERYAFQFDDTTCALCERYYDSYGCPSCPSCPISKHTGGRCDATNGPFSIFIKNGNPTNMIEVLKECILKEEKLDNSLEID